MPKPPGRGYKGQIPKRLWRLLVIAYEEGIFTSSNRARKYSKEIALMASLGWISNISYDGWHWSNKWRITFEGFAALQNKEEM